MVLSIVLAFFAVLAILTLFGAVFTIIGALIQLFGTRRNMYGEIIKRDKR